MPLEEIVAARGWRSIPNVNVLVEKSRWMLSIRSGDEVLKSYPVALGSEDMSDKQRRDDGLTPEGEFYICQRNLIADSHAWDSVWLRLSYPNAEDASAAAEGINTRAAEEMSAPSQARRPPQDTDWAGDRIHGEHQSRTWTMGLHPCRPPRGRGVPPNRKLRTRLHPRVTGHAREQARTTGVEKQGGLTMIEALKREHCAECVGDAHPLP